VQQHDFLSNRLILALWWIIAQEITWKV